MSRQIFINNLNTYVGKALFDELRGEVGEGEDGNTMLGTYLEKDASSKPSGVKKMLKVCILYIFLLIFVFRDANRGLWLSIYRNVMCLFMICILEILLI
jgi:hypothetical protein